jgi:aspartate aminotransferase
VTLTPDLERLLAAQERVDALRDHATRRAGAGLVDLAYANSHDGVPAPVLAALREALDSGRALDLQYTPYGGATVPRRMVAQSLASSHGEELHFRDVILTPGAMAGLNLLFRTLPAGSEVVVVTPCWLDYPLYLANLGLRAVLVPVEARSLRLDLPALEAALTERTAAVILSQPANPTGLCYRADELRSLADLLARAPRPPLLISDECHRDYVLPPATFVSPLASYDRTCLVHSFGKSLLLQGQRTGFVAVSPRHPERRELARLLERLMRVTGFCAPTALMQQALGSLLELRPALDRLVARRQRALQALEASGYQVVPSQGTFFLYPRTPGGADDFAFTERLASRGLLVLPAPVFHHRGHFRIALTASDQSLDRGLELLAEERGRA